MLLNGILYRLGWMPVAAKFSEEFYARFGHAATGELVEYLNTIDDTYRAELRSLNDSNWARFEAKLEQRASHLEALIERGTAEMRAELRAEFQAGLSQLEARIAARFSDSNTRQAKELTALESRLIKWMFRLWLGSTITTVGLVLTVVGLLR